MNNRKKDGSMAASAVLLLMGFILVGLPLVLRLVVVNVSPYEYGVIRSSSTYNDVFSYSKSCVLIAVCVIMFILVMVNFFSELGKTDTDTAFFKSPGFICLVAYGLMAIISTLFSSYKYVAVHGITERYEGLMVIICYIFIACVAMYMARSVKAVNFLLVCIIIGAFIIGLIGMGQFFGFDIFETDFAAKLIYGKYYTEGSALNARFENVYSVLYNPNYTGVFSALMFSLSTVLAILLPPKKPLKYAALILAVVSVINLIGSVSAGALMGVSAAIVFSAAAGIFILIKKGYLKKMSPALWGFSALFLVIVLAVGALVISSDSLSVSKAVVILDTLRGKTEQTSPYFWRDIGTEENRAVISTAAYEIEIEKQGEEPLLYINGEFLDYTDKNEEDGITYYNYALQGLAGARVFFINDLIYFEGNDGLSVTDFIFKETPSGIEGASKMGETYPLDTEVKSIGFKNLEYLGSGRGYIWSRSLPLIFNLKTFMVGSGPDTFSLEFPQKDIVGKTRYLGNPYLIVDKPHNFYIQTAVNTGVISLIIFLAAVLIYIITTIKAIMKSENTYLNSVRFALMAGLTAYLVSSLASDSNVGTAPYFWIILGLGLGLALREPKIRA